MSYEMHQQYLLIKYYKRRKIKPGKLVITKIDPEERDKQTGSDNHTVRRSHGSTRSICS